MKRFRYILLSFILLALCPMLVACGENTLESVPWRASANSEEEIIDMVDTRTEYMFSSGVSSASVPVTYKTTITYTFHNTMEGDILDRVVRDEIVLTMTRFKGEVSPRARYSVTRFVDGQVVSEASRVYIKSGSNMLCYIDSVDYVGEDRAEEKSRDMLSEYADGEYFLKLAGEVIKYNTLGNASRVYTKNFESVTYYMLSLASADNVNNAKKIFTSNREIFDNPSLLEMKDKVIDSISSMDYQYGINDDREGYLSYFAMNYSLSRYIEGLDGERETYLDVSMVTKLDKKGEEIGEIEDIEDKGEYTCAHFLKTATSPTGYVIYRESEGEDAYQQITVSSNGDNRFIKIEQFASGVLSSSNIYTIIDDEVYILDNTERTYTKVTDDTFSLPRIFYLDFTWPLLSGDSEQNIYTFGTAEDNYSLRLELDKVSCVIVGEENFEVMEYERSVKSDMNILLTSYTLIEP